MDINNIEKHMAWEKYRNPNFDWSDYSFYKTNQLSEDFVREFKDKVAWLNIFKYQTLSESFIKNIMKNLFLDDKRIWEFISKYQKLSRSVRCRICLLKLKKDNKKVS